MEERASGTGTRHAGTGVLCKAGRPPACCCGPQEDLEGHCASRQGGVCRGRGASIADSQSRCPGWARTRGGRHRHSQAPPSLGEGGLCGAEAGGRLQGPKPGGCSARHAWRCWHGSQQTLTFRIRKGPAEQPWGQSGHTASQAPEGGTGSRAEPPVQSLGLRQMSGPRPVDGRGRHVTRRQGPDAP